MNAEEVAHKADDRHPSQKGRSGKAMLCAHLAVESERNGPAWVIDTDHQATLSFWHERRRAETPQRLAVPVGKIKAGLAKMAEHGAAYCFIDTPPSVSEQNTALLEVADFVLIPVFGPALMRTTYNLFRPMRNSDAL